MMRKISIGSEVVLAIVSIFCALIAVPFVALLYLIPCVREAFNQLAYEDAMKG